MGKTNIGMRNLDKRALAGFNKNDIEVEYADSQLTIKSIYK